MGVTSGYIRRDLKGDRASSRAFGGSGREFVVYSRLRLRLAGGDLSTGLGSWPGLSTGRALSCHCCQPRGPSAFGGRYLAPRPDRGDGTCGSCSPCSARRASRDVVIDGDEGATVATVSEALSVGTRRRGRPPAPSPRPLRHVHPASPTGTPAPGPAPARRERLTLACRGPADPHRSGGTVASGALPARMRASAVPVIPVVPAAPAAGSRAGPPCCGATGVSSTPRPGQAVLHDGDKVTLDPRLARHPRSSRSPAAWPRYGSSAVRPPARCTGWGWGPRHRLRPDVRHDRRRPALAPEAADRTRDSRRDHRRAVRAAAHRQARRLKLKGTVGRRGRRSTRPAWPSAEAAELAAEVAGPPPAAGLATAAHRTVDWPRGHAAGLRHLAVHADRHRAAGRPPGRPGPEGGVAYNRPPRLTPSDAAAARAPRRPPATRDAPAVAGRVPARGARLALAYVLTGSWYFLLIALMTPVIMVGQWWSDRRHGKKQHRKALKRVQGAAGRLREGGRAGQGRGRDCSAGPTRPTRPRCC